MRFKSKKILYPLAAAGLAALVYLLWLPWVPALRHSNPERTAFMDLRVRQAAKKGKKLEQIKTWKDLDSISPYLVGAVLAAEDDTFYVHRGFDFDQIKIALRLNWKKKRYVYGGSTLTQQLARTLYLSPSKRILRKLKEAIITFWMEMALSKKRILELYLNSAEWGIGIYGAEAAAQHYYGKSSEDLSAEESAALASVLPSPRKWSPLRETPFMVRRRASILSRMSPGVEKSTDALAGPEAAEAAAEDGPDE
ncbi:MAG: monofunctional biosynthetic peptidoglycan transglycosylase [Elusimicrobia bacterium RIFCSPLOWO2_01_FULL_54_10]|nr:MAG: monofunctional biosynthetic peptidoglycan transglycosylase [Elusimicrobia bacterium RIFCSPLOWO2_01_FULL_54_10]